MTSVEQMRSALLYIINRHRPTWERRCEECNMDVPSAGCPTWIAAREGLGITDTEIILRPKSKSLKPSSQGEWSVEAANGDTAYASREVAEAVASGSVKYSLGPSSSPIVKAFYRASKDEEWSPLVLSTEQDQTND